MDRAARLDYLYQLLEAAGIDSVSGPGYATLTRASYDLIFERLMEKHNFTGVIPNPKLPRHRDTYSLSRNGQLPVTAFYKAAAKQLFAWLLVEWIS